MAQNFADSPSNGATQSFNGVTYTYNSSKGIWTGKTAQGITLTDLSVGSEPSASGDGAVSYNNTTGVITYTPPVLSSGGTTTVYNLASSLPLSGNSDGDMAFAKDNNRFYVWNGAGWYSVALVNATPTISSGVSSSVNLATDGTATVITITASDPEGTALSYGYSVTSGSLTNGGGASATVAQGTGASTNVFTVTPTTNQSYAGTFTLTFTASDGVNTATSAGAFSLVFSVPQTRGTAFKLKTSGTNARTNSSFDDSSTSNHTLTANGGVYQTTFNPYFPEAGYWGADFPTKADQLTFSSVHLGTGDWTIEAWVKPDNLSGYHAMIAHDNLSNSYFQFHMNGSHLEFYEASVLRASSVMVANEWQHVALTKDTSGSGNPTFTIYRNGKNVAQASHSTGVQHINRIANYSAGNNTEGFQGRMSNVRLSNTLRYTGDYFTPPSQFTSDSNTLLLACASNRFIDNSSNAVSLTPTSGSSIITDTPSAIKLNNVWKTTNGGSVWFEGGQTNFLSLPAIAVGTNTYEVSGWFWDETASGWGTILMLGAVSASSPYAGIRMDASRGEGVRPPAFFNDSGGGGAWECEIADTVTSTKNAWTHFVFSRNASNECKMFLNGVQKGSTITNTASIPNTATNYIGKGGSANQSFYGYLADFRIQVGGTPITANFTPPTAPTAVDSNTKLKLDFTQAGIFDAVASSNKIQLIGDTKESTAQTKYATTSILMDNSGDYIVSEDDIYKVGTQPFQFEAWCYCTGATTTQGLMQGAQANISTGNQGNSGSFGILTSTNSNWTIYHNAMEITSTYLTANAWHHVAMVRSTGKMRLFLNGTQIADVADTNDYSAVDTFHIGGCYNTSYIWDGHIEDPRFLIGHTTYPNEAPQTKLTAVTNTKLLTANASSIADSSTSSHSLTNVNSVTSTSFTPSNSTADYSYYFNGSNQRLELPVSSDFTFGTGNFSLEFYVNIPSTNSANGSANIVDLRNGTAGLNVYIDNSRNLTVGTETSGSWASFGAVQVEYNNWYHVSVSRHSSVLTYCVNGIVIATASNTNNFTTTGGKIGDRWNSNPTQYFKGYLCDLRIIKGSSNGFGASFTPPSAAL